MLNLIVICSDTFRADCLGCFGNYSVDTPCLDLLADDGVVFENAYADALPTIPARRVYFTGKSLLPFALRETKDGRKVRVNPWAPLRPEDVTLAQVLADNGYVCGFITDVYHYFKPDMNLHRGFTSWQWIRGQEHDLYKSGPRARYNPKDYMPRHLWNEQYDALTRQYLMNLQGPPTEDDYFVAQVCRAGIQWLEENAEQKPFFLWLDMFDPHEPWDPPKRYRDMYYDNYPCERFIFGYGARQKDIKPEDIPAIRGLYYGEVTFVDRWIGRFLERVDDLDLFDDTVIVFLNDHGTCLGEEGVVQKTGMLLHPYINQIPLIIRHPSGEYSGKRVRGLVSAADIMPTLLALLDIEPPPGVTGQNVWPLVTGKKRRIHRVVHTGFGAYASVRDLKWNYIVNYDNPEAEPGPRLYDLTDDPGETKNVVSKHRDVAKRMQQHIDELWHAE